MYEEYYHLQAKPFRLSPDPRFFFESRGHKRALAYLRYGLSQSEGFVVITGDPGTGKTTLAQILLSDLDQSDVVVAHLTTTQLEADQMLRMVAASFGLRYEGVDKAGLLKTLEAFLIARSRERKRVLLVVDEAQNLPLRSLEELRMLSNLQMGDRALFQTFLLGQVQFRKLLDHPDLEQMCQRVIANFHLSALAPDECKSYIETRLKHVGWEHDPEFTEEAYAIIFDHTKGIPRRINMLCDRVLLYSCLEEKHLIDKKVLAGVMDELQTELSGKPIQALQDNAGSVSENIGDTSEIIDASIKSTESNDSENQAADSENIESVDVNLQQDNVEPLAERETTEILEADNNDNGRSSVIENQTYDSFKSEALTEPEASPIEADSLTSDNAENTAKNSQDAISSTHTQKTAEETIQEKSDIHRQAKISGHAAAQEPPIIKPAAVNESVRSNAKEDRSWGEAVARKSDVSQIMGGSQEFERKNPVGKIVDNVHDKHQDRFRVITGGKDTAEEQVIRSVHRTLAKNVETGNVSTAMAAIPDAPDDSEEVSLRKALRLVLAYHRSPRSFPGLDDPSQPIPRGLTSLLQLAASDNAVIEGMRQIASMGISPAMLRAAVRYYIRRILFVPGADAYRVLGLYSDASLAEVEVHYGYMMKLMRMDAEDIDETSVAHIGHAYENLCRGELTSPAEVRREKAAAEDNSDIDVMEDLDLDLSPNAFGSMVAGRRVAPEGVGKNISNLIAGKEYAGPTTRNVLLLLGTVIVILVIYLFQSEHIKSSIIGDNKDQMPASPVIQKSVRENPLIGIPANVTTYESDAEASQNSSINESNGKIHDDLPIVSDESVGYAKVERTSQEVSKDAALVLSPEMIKQAEEDAIAQAEAEMRAKQQARQNN